MDRMVMNGQETDQDRALGDDRAALRPETAAMENGNALSRGLMPTNPKQHTECLMCSRTYFGKVLHKCPWCGSDSLQQYTTDELWAEPWIRQKVAIDTKGKANSSSQAGTVSSLSCGTRDRVGRHPASKGRLPS